MEQELHDVYSTVADLNLPKKLSIILDAAHGIDTSGKRAPDESFFEYQYSRTLIKQLKPRLEKLGYSVYETNTEEYEIGLTKRKKYASQLVCDNTKLLLSIHNNAASCGAEWKNATGFEFFTSPGFSKSDIFAECLYKEFEITFPDIKLRTDKCDGDCDKEAEFTVLMGSGYFACLAELLFMDSKKDLELLKCPNFMNSCCDAFVNSIELFNTLIQK